MIEHSQSFSRRNFLSYTSCFGAFYAVAKLIPLPLLAASLEQDSRVAQAPLVDKGFASVRKVGNGLYATISDTSKGYQTICNGGFLVGRDGVLLLEGFGSSGRSIVPNGCLAASEPGSGARGAGYALPFRSLHGQFILWRERSAALGPRRCGAADGGKLRGDAGHGQGSGAWPARTARKRCEI